ncbi:MAG: hypothetical protein IIY49_04230 [Eubacterium sp.]|nr:hypothetical protein [Eubacterium sp.]
MKKKFVVLTMAAMLALSSVACGNKKEEKNSENTVTTSSETEASKTEASETEASTSAPVLIKDASETDAQNKEIDKLFTEGPKVAVTDKEAKDGFANAVEAKYENLTFQIPDYFKYSEEISSDPNYYYYAEQSETTVVDLTVTIQNGTGIKKEDAKAAKDDFIRALQSTGDVTVTNAFETEIAGYYTLGADVNYNMTNFEGTGRLYFIFDTDVEKIVGIGLVQTNNSQYDYTSDFEKIIASIKVAQ